jgi:Flp pilus assembly protein TadG
MNVFYRNQKTPQLRTQRAQAIVEFALVLPILMLLLVGIFEVGRMIYTYAAINNASREAARFASALGFDDAGYHKYRHCAGIQDMARRSAYFIPLTITISYDRGPGFSSFAVCDAPSGEDGDFNLTTNDRVNVTVSGTYTPLVKLIPFGTRTFTSISSRTILGFVAVGDSPSSGSGSGVGYTSTPTSNVTSTATTTATATITNTPTKTATLSPLQPTFTPLPSSTPTLIPTSTPTATMTATATSTPTPTSTSTPISTCTITASDIFVASNSNAISMTITNPYTSVIVSNIVLTWDNNGGQGNPKTLTLDSVNLGTTFWSGLNNSTGTATLTPSSTLTLPGNNATSTLIFTFLQNYNKPNMKGTTITINFSTPGCSAITKIAN